MNSRVWHSFRMEIILYALLAMLFSVMTVTALSAGVWFIGKEVNGQKKHLNEKNAEWETNSVNSADFIGRNQESELADESEKMTDDLSKKRAAGIYFEEKKPYFGGWLVGIIFLTLFFFILYFLLLTRKFARYLNEITECIQEISAGNFNVEVSIRHEDELSRIAQGLNKMTGDIKLMMEKERNMEYAKNELITNVAHDLRTPLTSIIGYLGLVAGNEKLDWETKTRYVAIAYDKSKRLERLIDDLFSFTKVSFGQITLRKSTVDILKLTEQLLDEFYPSIQEAGLTTEFICEEKQLLMEVDGDLMARAVANLLSNAIKYGRDGKILRVELKRTKTALKLMVTNYGKLISKSDLEHIFDKFYRVESSRSTDTGGTGLGLAIARNIVRMHNGTIHVKSNPAGTVFTVSLYYHAEDNPEGEEEDESEKE